MANRPTRTVAPAGVPGDSPDGGAAGPAAGADWRDFERGYLTAGGDPAYTAAFEATLACEGSQWSGYYGQNGYWSRAQFSLDTWPKIVTRFFGVPPNDAAQRTAADSPLFVGLAVAWWASVTVPSEQWPGCGRNAGLP